MKNKKFFSCICSPGIGILDNWLPVIFELNKLNPDNKFICVLSKASVVELSDPTSELLRLAQSVFSKIAFVTHSGIWLQVDTFELAKEINTLSDERKILLRILNRLDRFVFKGLLTYLVNLVYKKLDRVKYSKYQFDSIEYAKSVNAILYDIYEEAKEYNQYFLSLNKSTPKFSIKHGLEIDVYPIVQRCDDRKSLGAIKVYMSSDSEYKYYTDTYKVKDNDILTVGITRHDKDWIDFIIKNHSSNNEQQWSDYIFIISRSLSSYFPYKKKKKALQDIKKLLIDEMKLKIIVKCHPKERNDGLYEDVFGIEQYGYTWVYTNQHPFVVGSNSKFAITFFSGVSIDMLAIGIPVIEYLDLKDLKEGEGQYFLVGKDEQAVLSYRYLGFVLGASNYLELKKHVNSILNDRIKVMDELYAVYKDNFSINGGVSRAVASDILLNISSGNELEILE